ncbi:hypothetical protein MJT46_002006 [Ovis ammon polii x Ovis aries]|nr:hypothetical protein MJT46_002006 [Ovis ammon polii x Ovis aries]
MPTVKNSEEILTSEWWSQYMVSYRNEKCELSPTLILQDILAVYVLPVLFRQDRKETSLHWAPRIRSGKSLCWFSCPPGTVAWVAQIRRSRGLASGPREDSIQHLTDKGVCCRSWPRLTVRHELAPTLMTVFTKLDRKGLTALIRGTGLDWSLCQATEQDRWLGCPDSSGHVEEC